VIHVEIVNDGDFEVHSNVCEDDVGQLPTVHMTKPNTSVCGNDDNVMLRSNINVSYPIIAHGFVIDDDNATEWNLTPVLVTHATPQV
jgi:hypothetical protein